ncbi:hypothetical protein DIPPA_11168 [Diplonema papillatum]|nr:hypothetical protein DIPPA_11168 [Diplonema papillatum]
MGRLIGALLLCVRCVVAEVAEVTPPLEVLSVRSGETVVVRDVRVPGFVDVELLCVAGTRNEVKVSYPAVQPAAVTVEVHTHRANGRATARELLNVEKSAFVCSAGGIRHTARITLGAEGVRPRAERGEAAGTTTTLHVHLDQLAFGVVPGEDTLLLAGLIVAAVAFSHWLAAPLLLRVIRAESQRTD